MAEQSKIEWCDASFNPWWGCERVSPACAHCYADTFAIRLGMDIWDDKRKDGSLAPHGFRFFGDKHWDEPLKWARTLPAKLGRRPRVFCASMADVFEERPELELPRWRLFTLIRDTPELDWLVLTKRPEFARDWLVDFYELYAGLALHREPGARVALAPGFPGFDNIWLGVSIENARYTWRADVLREIPAAVRFISAEPLLGSLYDGRRDDEEAAVPAGPRRAPLAAGLARARVARVDAAPTTGDLQEHEERPLALRSRAPLDLSGIDWLIIGGESGPKARPFHLEHAREIVRAAGAEAVRRGDGSPCCGNAQALTGCHSCPNYLGPDVFVKQLGARPHQGVPAFDGSGRHSLAIHLRDRKGGDTDEWPADLRIREFPATAMVAA